MTVAELRSQETSRPAAGSFYRPELDVLRFAAFFLVYLHHTIPREGIISHLGPTLSMLVTSFAKACGFGLCLFFALSAYLITELLVREKNAKGKLDMKAFYIRRILRIWPLYFLGLGIGVAFAFLKPAPGMYERYATYAALAGNWYCAAHIGIQGKNPMEILWSISVEEQFYVFWPWIAAKTRKVLQIAAIVLLIASSVALIVIARMGATTDAAWFNSFVQFGCFGAGTLLSLRLRGRTIHWGSGKRLLAVSSAALLWMIAAYAFHLKDPGTTSGFNLVAGYLAVEAGCVLMLLAIMGVSASRLPKAFIYLGRISFGLYVFHALSLHLAFMLLARIPIVNSWLSSFLLGLVITIALAATSYRFYETPFLKLKKRLEVIKTRV